VPENLNLIFTLSMSKKRLEIFVDANSFKHLAEVEINRKPSYQKVFENYNVFTCTVVKKEFAKNVSSRPLSHQVLSKKLSSNKVRVPRTRKIRKLEYNWLNRFYKKEIKAGKDEGERHLVCTLIEMIIEKNISRAILVTDDYTARKSFIDDIFKCTNLGEIWNTADLLLHLYLITNSISFEIIQDAMRDVISIESMSWKKYFVKGKDEQSDAKLKMIKDYNSKLIEVKELKNKYK